MYNLPKVFVVPGNGVKMPLPIDGMRIPALGMVVARSVHIERLLRTGDLLEGEAAQAAVKARTAEAATNKPAVSEEAKNPAAQAVPPAAPMPPSVETKVQPGAAVSKG